MAECLGLWTYMVKVGRSAIRASWLLIPTFKSILLNELIKGPGQKTLLLFLILITFLLQWAQIFNWFNTCVQELQEHNSSFFRENTKQNNQKSSLTPITLNFLVSFSLGEEKFFLHSPGVPGWVWKLNWQKYINARKSFWFILLYMIQEPS